MSELPETTAKEQLLLKHLIEQYILDGTPVGSKALAENPQLNVSSATIRNVMADLEAKGYVIPILQRVADSTRVSTVCRQSADAAAH